MSGMMDKTGAINGTQAINAQNTQVNTAKAEGDGQFINSVMADGSAQKESSEMIANEMLGVCISSACISTEKSNEPREVVKLKETQGLGQKIADTTLVGKVANYLEGNRDEIKEKFGNVKEGLKTVAKMALSPLPGIKKVNEAAEKVEKHDIKEVTEKLAETTLFGVAAKAGKKSKEPADNKRDDE